MKTHDRAIRSARLLILLSFVLPSQVLAASLPEEVSAYVSRRGDCDHFRGEASPDAKRQADINRELARLCKGSDAELARLLRRYSENKAVREALDIYDPDIEMDVPPK